MARAKPKPKPKITHGGPHAWSAGDRVGKTFPAHLREQLVRAGIGLEIDRDAYTDAVESCLRVLEAIAKAVDELDETNVPIEEAPDAIAILIKRIATLSSTVDDNEKAADQRYDDLVSAQRAADKDHAEDIAEHCRQIDELRKRAELAEHERDELRATLAPYAKPMRRRSAAKPMSFAAMCAESASKAANEHGAAVTITINPEPKK